MILDPGDFSGSSGRRLGWTMPLLLWHSATGRMMLLALVISLAVFGIAAFPFAVRLGRWSLTRWRQPQGVGF